MRIGHLLVFFAIFFLTACGGVPSTPEQPVSSESVHSEFSRQGHEVVLFALGLIDTGYRFGGKNPDAGFDCSGMVAYIYHQAVGLKFSGNAADIARKGRQIERSRLRPGDLVFFNTLNAPYSHVGVYIGDDRFVHAPSGNGRVRIDHLNASYYAQRFEAARSYFD